MAPILIEENPIGLNTVGNSLVRGLMLSLQLHNFAKVVQPQDSRFPTMPGKINHRIEGSINVLDDVFLEERFGHLRRLTLRVKKRCLQVVTIVTVQVADRATRLGKNLKFTRGLAHCSIPDVQAKPHQPFDRNVHHPALSGMSACPPLGRDRGR
jgi:hypothetical protein